MSETDEHVEENPSTQKTQDEQPRKGSPEWKKQQGQHLAKAEKKRLEQKQNQQGVSRRSLLKYVPSTVGVSWLLFAGGLGTCSVAGARFMIPNVTFKPPQTFKAGYPAEYEPGAVETKYKAEKRTWIIYTQNDVANKKAGFFALQAKCTHLGCTPNWLGSQGIFKCPCHGSGYYKSGINFEGPAPRPMERFKIWLAEDGMITVDKSISFPYDGGSGWAEPAAFLSLSEAGLA